MTDVSFFERSGPFRLDDICRALGITCPEGFEARLFHGTAPLDLAGPMDVSFLDSPKYAGQASLSRAGAVLVSERFAARVSPESLALVVQSPSRAFSGLVARFFPTSAQPSSFFGVTGVFPGAFVHPQARLEPEVTVDPGAVIGAGVEIGRGTIIGPGAVLGPKVRVGRDCRIGPQVTLQHTLVGNRVVVHPGAQIGQDGFGYHMSAAGHAKVPQVGRVVIQDDVEIGANTTIDRGGIRDTIIGEGTKIDNQVQIAHNVSIGRHCIIVGQAGIAGSAILEDFVVVAGGAGVAGHVRVGRGAEIAGGTHVKDDVPAGERVVGTPARPVREWMAEQLAVKRLVKRRDSGDSGKE